jgi:hypothetical protein
LVFPLVLDSGREFERSGSMFLAGVTDEVRRGCNHPALSLIKEKEVEREAHYGAAIKRDRD